MMHKIKLKVRQKANKHIIPSINRLVECLYTRFEECDFMDNISSLKVKVLNDKYEKDYLLIIKTKTSKWLAVEFIWAMFRALNIHHEFEILELK